MKYFAFISVISYHLLNYIKQKTA